jgi:hypothetical protein
MCVGPCDRRVKSILVPETMLGYRGLGVKQVERIRAASNRRTGSGKSDAPGGLPQMVSYQVRRMKSTEQSHLSEVLVKDLVSAPRNLEFWK